MEPVDFTAFQSYLKKTSGLVLSADKAYLVESRLNPLVRQYQMENLSAIANEIRRGVNRALLRDVTEAMTTNETSFLRDGKPFENFKKFVLPLLLEKKAATKKFRIWSSACSSGQEPYTLAMFLKEEGIKLAGWNIEIVATDLSNDILTKAKQGEYSQFEVQRGLPITLLMKYFTQKEDRWQIKPEIQQMITFKQVNLLEDFRALGKFDIIFCRNVLIYFDAPTKKDVLERMAQLCDGQTSLFLGGAETVIGITDHWKPYPQVNGLYIPSS
jgi:chemotaxis protein methyltransferase CheR